MHRDQYVSDGSEYAGLHLEYTESVECYDRPGLVELAQDDPAPDDPAYYAPTLGALWNAFGEERLGICRQLARLMALWEIRPGSKAGYDLF